MGKLYLELISTINDNLKDTKNREETDNNIEQSRDLLLGQSLIFHEAHSCRQKIMSLPHFWGYNKNIFEIEIETGVLLLPVYITGHNIKVWNKVLTIIVATISFNTKMCRFLCSSGLPLPLSQSFQTVGTLVFSIPWTIIDRREEQFFLKSFENFLFIMMLEQTWAKNMIQNPIKYWVKDRPVYIVYGGGDGWLASE